VALHWFVEPRLRHVVAETLGVDLADLRPDVSLSDDLAADSLDLAELAVRVESEFGMAVPDRVMDSIGTYGDFVRAAAELFRGHTAGELGEPPVRIRARLVTSRGELVRADVLTPYAVETISTDALFAAHDTRLELSVSGGADEALLRRIRDEFAWLGERGVEVLVERESGFAASTSAAA